MEFEGDYEEGRKEGFGKLYHPNGRLKYKGTFVKGKMNGWSVKIFNDSGN